MRRNKQTSGERIVKDIKRKTRKQYSAEEKIRIVLDGLRGEESVAELCRREGISQGIYYKWSKDFMEAGKKRLAGDIVRQANSAEVNRTSTLAIPQSCRLISTKEVSKVSLSLGRNPCHFI
jgi:transposase